MRYPFVGERVYYREYFKGSAKTHLVGMLGGAIWCLGGVFVWKEFKGADKRVNRLLALMFCFFVAGLAFIIASGN